MPRFNLAAVGGRSESKVLCTAHLPSRQPLVLCGSHTFFQYFLFHHLFVFKILLL